MGRIKKEIEYRFTIGPTMEADLESLYKTHPDYLEFFLEITARLRYGDEDKRNKINEQLISKAEEMKTGAYIRISGSDERSDKTKRHRLRIKKIYQIK